MNDLSPPFELCWCTHEKEWHDEFDGCKICPTISLSPERKKDGTKISKCHHYAPTPFKFTKRILVRPLENQ